MEQIRADLAARPWERTGEYPKTDVWATMLQGNPALALLEQFAGLFAFSNTRMKCVKMIWRIQMRPNQHYDPYHDAEEK